MEELLDDKELLEWREGLAHLERVEAWLLCPLELGLGSLSEGGEMVGLWWNLDRCYPWLLSWQT